MTGDNRFGLAAYIRGESRIDGIESITLSSFQVQMTKRSDSLQGVCEMGVNEKGIIDSAFFLHFSDLFPGILRQGVLSRSSQGGRYAPQCGTHRRGMS